MTHDRDMARVGNLSASERIADLLADLLFDADEVLDALTREDADSIRWLEPPMRRIFNDLDTMIRKLSV